MKHFNDFFQFALVINIVLTSTLPVILLLLCLSYSSVGQVHIASQAVEGEDLDIQYLYIFSEIKYRYARTKLWTQIENTKKDSILTNFTISIPKDGFPTDFSIETNGIQYKGYIAIEEIAQTFTCNSLKSNAVFGFVKKILNSSSSFGEQQYAIVLNIPGYQKVKANFTYDNYVERIEGVNIIYTHKIRIIPQHAYSVKEFKVSVNITEFNLRSSGFVSIPGNLNKGKHYGVPGSDVLINPSPYSPSHVHQYEPNATEINEMATEQILGVSKIQYTLGLGFDERRILVRDGYFVHQSHNSILQETLPRHVIFVLDVSGSMLGKRMESLKIGINRTLSFMLESSRTADNPYNNFIEIITFSKNATVWEPLGKNSDPLQLDNNLMKHALNYINQLKASGSSNLYDAISEAIRIGKRALTSNNNYPSSIIFLITDGEPTSGIISPSEITRQLLQANENNTVPIYSLSFGSEADYSLCRDLSTYVSGGRGLSRKLYPELNASNYIFEFYKEITSPSLQNVTFVYTNSRTAENRNIANHERIRVDGSSLIIDSNIVNMRYLNSNLLPCGEKCFLEKVYTLKSFSGIYKWSNITTTSFCFKSYSRPTSNIQRKFMRIIDLSLKYDLVTACTSMIANRESQFQLKLEDLPLSRIRSAFKDFLNSKCV